MLKPRILLLLLTMMVLPISAQKVNFPQKGKLFHYAPYPRGVSFENPGELLDEVKLLPMQCYDFERDSVWKAPRQPKGTSDERGIQLEHLFMVDADVSFAKAGSKQSLYIAFTLDKGDEYPGPVAFMNRGEQPSEWYYPFRFNSNREIRLEGRANPTDTATCVAQWRIPEFYKDLCRILVEMEKDGKTTVYLADTALVFYNTARTDAAQDPNRMVLCPFKDGRIYELVFYNRFLSEKEKYEVLRHGTPDGDWDNKYTIPEPQVIQNHIEIDKAPMGIHWDRFHWISIVLSILLALISLYVRFFPMNGVPYTFNGSWIIIGLAVVGALFYIYLVPNGYDNKYLYYISIIAGYWLVSFVPDPSGYYQSQKTSYDLSKLNGCIWLIIIVVVGSLAYMFGPAVSTLLPLITIYMFCKNMWLTREARQYLKK
ncbi:MAG: hypothetical protein J5524_11620 [Bacteroidaceae bacterium]|nr:hypothetical protein [Bacteroidaceae bacterium]